MSHMDVALVNLPALPVDRQGNKTRGHSRPCSHYTGLAAKPYTCIDRLLKHAYYRDGSIPECLSGPMRHNTSI
jgi:hypothetical protein